MGDLHGNTRALWAIDRLAQSEGVQAVVQTGDFGILWPGGNDGPQKFFHKRSVRGQDNGGCDIPWFFCDGNHDNHDRLRDLHEVGNAHRQEVVPNLFHITRGKTLDVAGTRILFCGGARSTDRGAGWREHHNGNRIWWPQEAPDGADLQCTFDSMEVMKPKIVVTHEAPSKVDLYREDRDTDPTARGLDQIHNLSTHKAALWFFGHHHVLEEFPDTSGAGTRFLGCGLEGQGWLWDVETGELRQVGSVVGWG